MVLLFIRAAAYIAVLFAKSLQKQNKSVQFQEEN